MLFDKDLIVMPDREFQTKEDVLHFLTHLENARVADAEKYERDVLDREASFATYTVAGIAIPHAKSDFVAEPFVAFARLKHSVAWGQEPGEAADKIFLLGVPKSGTGGCSADFHLKILAHLSKNLMHDDFRDALSGLETKEKIYDLLRKIEEEMTL